MLSDRWLNASLHGCGKRGRRARGRRDGSISFSYILLFPRHIYAPFLKDSALCNCFFFLFWFVLGFFLYIYIYIVHHLHCCEESVSRFDFCAKVRAASADDQANEHCCYIQHFMPCLCAIWYDLTNAHIWEYVASGPERGFRFGLCESSFRIEAYSVHYRVTTHCILLLHP